MSYSNITIVTAQGTYGYELGTSISYNTLDLIADIPHAAQLEIERIFSTDRNGLTATIPNFLNNVHVSVVDKQKVFLIPVSRCTFNTATKQITAVNLPASGEQVYDFTYIPISGPDMGVQQTIAVPALQAGDNIIIRRKTVSNTPLVQWVPGSKLTTAQLNLNTLQMLYLIQEILNKVTVVSVSTEQILDNAITSSKILNKSVTFSKLQNLSGPLKLLGSGSDPINFQDVREMSVGPGFDVVGNVIDVKPIANGQRNDINVVAANSDWRINPNAVTYAKMQAVAAANRVLGSTTANGAVSEVQVNTNMLADDAVTLAKMQEIPTDTFFGRAASGSGNPELLTITSAGRELINDPSISAMRQTLELGSAALQESTAFATASHTHGNLTSDGRVGSTSGLPLITTTNGTITTGNFGTTVGTFAQGNDSRFNDARTPVAHTHPTTDITGLSDALALKSNVGHTHLISEVTNLQNNLDSKVPTSLTISVGTGLTGGGALTTDRSISVNFGTTSGTVAQGNDSRFTDARTPLAHIHTTADVTGLDSALAGKANTSHTHSFADITVGTLSVANGGTGLTSTPQAGQILIGNNTGYSLATITAGTNIAISNSPGGITISQVGEPQPPSALIANGTYGDINVNNTTWSVVDNAIGTAELANDGVTFDKLQNIATDRLLGRASAGSGNVEEITLTSAGRALLDDADATAQRTTLGLGTASTRNVPTTGNAASAEAVLGNDTRLSDTRTPTDNTVTTAKIVNSNVTYAKIQNVSSTDRILGRSSNDAGVVEEIICTSFGRALLDDTSVAAQRSTLGLGTSAILNVPSTGDAASSQVVLGNDTRLTNARTPVEHTHNTNDIVDDAITYAKIQNVTTANRVLGSLTAGGPVTELEVQTNMVANLAITSAKLATDAVTTEKIANLNVTTAKIADGAVTADKLASGSVSYHKLPLIVTGNRVLGATSNGSVVGEVQINTDMVLNNAITTVKIADANVTSGKLAAGAAAANLGTGGVTASLIATDAVTTLKILDLNVTSSKIANNAITNEKLRNSNPTSVLGRAMNTVGMVEDITATADNQVLMRHNGMLEFRTHSGMDIENYSIPPNKLEKFMTTNRVLGSSAVDGTISATQVTSGMIADGAVTVAKLAGDLVIPAANLPTEAKLNSLGLLSAASGNLVTFTGIPENAKRITIGIWGVSLTSNDNIRIRLVTPSGVYTTGYAAASTRFAVNSLATISSTDGFRFATLNSSMIWFGTAVLTRQGAGSAWIINGQLASNNFPQGQQIITCAGAIWTGQTNNITGIQISPVSGSFDGVDSSITVYYEV